MAQIEIRCVGRDEIALLAEMNSRLVGDQGGENTWSLADYEQRFLQWFDDGTWQLDVILENDQIVGYAVYQQREDYYDPKQNVMYVRQFYIERGCRGRGLGEAAFEKLIEMRFPKACDAIALDVVAENSGGMAFWSKLGFETYFTALKRSK